jgi:hypothetical protein
MFIEIEKFGEPKFSNKLYIYIYDQTAEAIWAPKKGLKVRKTWDNWIYIYIYIYIYI